jgi:hypothetical protein
MALGASRATHVPMLWGEQILGWANLKVVDGRPQHELGFAGPRLPFGGCLADNATPCRK